jgi:hypothetical protein
MEIVYAFVGRLPAYIVETIHQARLFSNDKITLICNDVDSPHLSQIQKYNVSIVNYESVIDSNFLAQVNAHISKFCIAEKLGDRRLLFIRSFERFFLLQRYMEITGAKNILFLELDMLIYFQPKNVISKFSEREITLCYTDSFHTCSAFCYIKSVDILRDMNTFFINYINNPAYSKDITEMQALTVWLKEPSVKQRVWMLPGYWQDNRYNKDIWDNLEVVDNILYDSVGIGVRVDGPDATHVNEWLSRGKIWWATEVNYAEADYIWKEEDNLRMLYLINPATKQEYKVNCIHVHNKNLPVFLSKPLLELSDKSDFIHGDRFLKMADIVIRKKSRTDYYEVKGWDQRNLIFFEDIVNDWQNPKSLFCNTEDLDAFLDILPKISNPFVLLSHNSDRNITETYLPLCDHPKLIRWFTQNLCISHPKVSFLPIGFANPVWAHGDYKIIQQLNEMKLAKANGVYANFLVETNKEKRLECLKVCNVLGIQISERCPPRQFFCSLATSFFSLCPEGNGIDTHRFWESLYFKTLPIVIRNPLTERLAKDFPCILLDSWLDLSGNKIEYDGSLFNETLEKKLSFEYYASQIRDAINSF